MCHNRITAHRCGYRSQDIQYCSNAGRSPATGKRVMCNNRSSTVSNQSDALCPKGAHRPCELSKKRGHWICCICDCGEGEDGPNRYKWCSGGDCSHEVCSDCKAWTKS